MNQTQFAAIAGWDEKQLWSVCEDLTRKHGHVSALNILMNMRRNMQVALSKYSKGKSTVDRIQKKALWVTEMIARWCGQYYKQWALRELIKGKPDLAKHENKQKLKGLTNEAWERYIRKMSY